MACTGWCPLVCFAGVGPGEVLAGGRKLVGISQRRTRAGARFQCAVHVRVVAGAVDRGCSPVRCPTGRSRTWPRCQLRPPGNCPAPSPAPCPPESGRDSSRNPGQIPPRHESRPDCGGQWGLVVDKGGKLGGRVGAGGGRSRVPHEAAVRGATTRKVLGSGAMFVGVHERQLDDKGRLALPSAFRSLLGDACYLVHGDDRCVNVYSTEAFEATGARHDGAGPQRRGHRSLAPAPSPTRRPA